MTVLAKTRNLLPAKETYVHITPRTTCPVSPSACGLFSTPSSTGLSETVGRASPPLVLRSDFDGPSIKLLSFPPRARKLRPSPSPQPIGQAPRNRGYRRKRLGGGELKSCQSFQLYLSYSTEPGFILVAPVSQNCSECHELVRLGLGYGHVRLSEAMRERPAT